MIKKLLFVASIFSIGFCSAQSFRILDYNDVNITNTTHTENGTNNELSLTKFHIENLTNGLKSFAIKVEKVYVPYANSGLGVCFGTACFSASATVSGTQIIANGVGDDVAANGIYTDLKISPVTWPWIDCANDYATWIVTVYDPANPSDEATATIVWDCGSSSVSIDEVEENMVSLNAFPNPAKNNLTVNYAVKGSFNTASIELFDVLGQKLISKNLASNKGEVRLNINSLNAGVYFYSIRVNGQAVKTERVIVQ